MTKSIEHIEDSLVNILKSMPRDTAYLDMISTIEQLLLDSPRFLFYAELKEKEARRLNSPRYICASMRERAIYYSNREMLDSFYYWKDQMDPIALEHKEYNYYFFIRNLEVTLLISDKKIELAIQTANQIYDEAKKYNSKEGLVAANQSIGRALLAARKYEEALKSYETSLSLIEKGNVSYNSFRMQAYSYLLILCELTQENKKGLEYAAEEEEFIHELQLKNTGKGSSNSYLLSTWVELQLKKASFLVKTNQSNKALHVLESIKDSYEAVRTAIQRRYHLAFANYYESIGQFNQALDELNIAYTTFPNAEELNEAQIMEQRGRLMESVGLKDDAIHLYKSIITFKDSTNNKWFDSQLNELRTIYDTDHLKIKNQELELKNKHTQLKTIRLFLGLTILILIGTLLLFIRSYRLKKKLECSERKLLEDKELLIKSEQTLRIAKEKAEEARDMALKVERKESFMANMSHEIRTPLNAIVGFSNLLVSDEELEPEERKLFITTINQNCDLLLKLINDILDLSRIESGKMSFYRQECSLTDLMDEVYQTHKMMIPSGVDFQKEVPEIPAFANTDRIRIKQVITNFINNAVKFTTSGHIKIGYKLNPVEHVATLFVEDTGKGIPEDKQDKIFERFYKQDEFDKGTGLGLSICTVIAEKLDGKLTLTSQPGTGSCFAIVIPYL